MVTIKISELNNITSTTPNIDVLAIVSGGATKNITVNDLINSAVNINITGKIVATSFTGSLLGNVTGTATSASYVLGSNVDGAVELANTASYVLGSNVDGAVELANTASYVEYTNINNKPTLVSGSEQITIGDTTGNLLGSRIFGPVADAVDAVSASYVLASDIDQPFSIIEVTGSLGVSGSSTFTGTTITFNTSSLPTTDPSNVGQLWRSGSVGNEIYLMVSLG